VPYNEELAARMRFELDGEPGLTERKMFGGLGFMINGNMAVAASSKGGLMIRVSPEAAPKLLGAHVRPMEMGGRSMGGWLLADSAVTDDEAEFVRLVRLGRDFARSLPPKKK
jgi:TfoX/Sxy family transcriptional regulator of competence genes